jgi:hypothetical protein
MRSATSVMKKKNLRGIVDKHVEVWDKVFRRLPVINSKGNNVKDNSIPWYSKHDVAWDGFMGTAVEMLWWLKFALSRGSERHSWLIEKSLEQKISQIINLEFESVHLGEIRVFQKGGMTFSEIVREIDDEYEKLKKSGIISDVLVKLLYSSAMIVPHISGFGYTTFEALPEPTECMKKEFQAFWDGFDTDFLSSDIEINPVIGSVKHRIGADCDIIDKGNKTIWDIKTTGKYSNSMAIDYLRQIGLYAALATTKGYEIEVVGIYYPRQDVVVKIKLDDITSKVELALMLNELGDVIRLDEINGLVSNCEFYIGKCLEYWGDGDVADENLNKAIECFEKIEADLAENCGLSGVDNVIAHKICKLEEELSTLEIEFDVDYGDHNVEDEEMGFIR